MNKKIKVLSFERWTTEINILVKFRLSDINAINKLYIAKYSYLNKMVTQNELLEINSNKEL
jgi:hypothetical protein